MHAKASPYSAIRKRPAEPRRRQPRASAASAGGSAGLIESGPRWMFLLYCGYFFVEFMRPQDLLPALGAAKPGMLMALPLAAAWVIKGDKSVLGDRLVKLYIALLALTALSTLYAVNTFWPVSSAKTLTLYLLCAALPASFLLSDAFRLRRFFDLFLLINCGLSIYALTHAGRGPGSFLGDENDLALCVNFAMPFAMYFALLPGTPLRQRLLYGAATGLMIAAVVASGSRGGFVTTVAVLLGVVLLSKRPVRYLLVVGLVAGIAALSLPDQYVSEMETISDTGDSTRQDRIWSWKMGYRMWQDNPWLGVGAGNYPWRVAEYEWQSPEFDPQTMKLHAGRAAHSFYVSVLSELGLVGSVLMTWLLWSMWRRQRRCARAARDSQGDAELEFLDALSRGLQVALGAFLAGGLFLTVHFYPYPWVLVGWTLAVERVIRLRLRALGRSDEVFA